MNTQHLWYFINTAQTRSIRKAAYYCNTSPGTIASALNELSKQLLVPLYTKTNYGIELTDEGRCFYSAAQNILSKLDKCMHFFSKNNINLDGNLHFSAVPGIMSYILAPIFNVLAENYPHLDMTFFTGSPEDILDRINTMRDDIGYFNISEDDWEYYSEKYPDIIFSRYITCDYVFLASRQHPLAKKISVSIDDLLKHPTTVYVHHEVTDNPFYKANSNIQFTQNENYNSQLIKDYNYLTIIPYLNKKMQPDFLDIHSQVLLFPKVAYPYYIACIYHKKSTKLQLIHQYLDFANLFY